MTEKNQLLMRLARHYEYREQPFKLSSGESSHEYLDCRLALSDPHTLSLAAGQILDLIIDRHEIDAVGGLTMGADPLAIAVSLSSQTLRWFSIRKEAKQHGTGKLIEGFSELRGRVVVLEDVSTTGASAKKAKGVCYDAGWDVSQIVTLVDRGGVELLRSLCPEPQVVSVLPFGDVSVVGKARQIALKAHGDQRYGNPKTGPSYSVHLENVVSIVAEMCPYDPYLLAAAWLHDVLEDTQETVDSLAAQNVSGVVRYLVDACTDGEGRNRKERKERSYKLIPNQTDAVVIKLADRISNVEAACRNDRSDLSEMYRKEQSEFRERLKNSLVSVNLDDGPLWDRLEMSLSL